MKGKALTFLFQTFICVAKPSAFSPLPHLLNGLKILHLIAILSNQPDFSTLTNYDSFTSSLARKNVLTLPSQFLPISLNYELSDIFKIRGFRGLSHLKISSLSTPSA